VIQAPPSIKLLLISSHTNIILLMAIYRIQGAKEKSSGIYYEFDSDLILGEGGMGKVYKGRCIDINSNTSRSVAVKFMYSDLPSYAIEKARRESTIHFRHDNLIEMLGFIETETETPYGDKERHYHVVSELLEGVSLDKFFAGKLTDQYGHTVPYAEKLYKEYQQDPVYFSVNLIKNILSGLTAMHDKGFIHRDIDPSNIMITSNGHIKLIDFGIAKKYQSLTEGDRHLTQAGQFVGKPEYAAPELVLGAINEQNPTTDLYAVGILLFQCIVGHVPFQGDRSDVLQKQLHAPMPLRLLKNRQIRDIVRKATEKSRGKRYRSASEFRVDLDNVDMNRRHTDIDLGKVVRYVAGTAAAATLFFGAYFTIDRLHQSLKVNDQEQRAHNPENGENETEEKTLSYSVALNELKDKERSAEGIQDLRQLSEEGDANASYLLSRLYFQSKLSDDYCPDSISELRHLAGIATDNITAHQLLQTAVNQDPDNYYALYDLACDYWKADQRTDAVSDRDAVKAEEYFRNALTQAEKVGDKEYVKMISSYLDAIEKWKFNVHIIQTKKYR